MKVAIDKNTINQIKDFSEFDYIYVFDDEPLDYLLKLGIKCTHKSFLDEVDINLSSYNINCIKKANISDKNWKVKPKLKQNKFAIIVPNYNNDRGNYNGKTYIRSCIDSILSQTYTKFELIIVDDMSTDTSVETIESYKDKRIHLIKNIRKRYNGGSRNVGIEYALTNFDFNYFCFIDSDDWWKDNKVLENINARLHNHELMTIGCEMIFSSGTKYAQSNRADNYEDLYALNGKVWCTAWARIIRKDKIVYFCEDTLMEDRVWAYRLADNINFDNYINYDKECYCWNRMNTTNSVSLVRNEYWDACAYCHIGHQLQLITNLKHKEMIPKIKQRIEKCKEMVNNGKYQQY